MGGCTFQNSVTRKGKASGWAEEIKNGQKYLTQTYENFGSAKEAFNHVVDQARHEHGHGGYTGTIAEKRSFVPIATVATLKEAEDMAYDMLEKDDVRIADKWGPAGCITVREGEVGWVFFGWASS